MGIGATRGMYSLFASPLHGAARTPLPFRSQPPNATLVSPAELTIPNPLLATSPAFLTIPIPSNDPPQRPFQFPLAPSPRQISPPRHRSARVPTYADLPDPESRPLPFPTHPPCSRRPLSAHPHASQRVSPKPALLHQNPPPQTPSRGAGLATRNTLFRHTPTQQKISRTNSFGTFATSLADPCQRL